MEFNIDKKKMVKQMAEDLKKKMEGDFERIEKAKMVAHFLKGKALIDPKGNNNYNQVDKTIQQMTMQLEQDKDFYKYLINYEA